MEDVPWEECFLPAGRNPELEREMRRAYGTVPEHARDFTECPWVPRADAALMVTPTGLRHLALEQALRIGLVVSQDNSCRYCFASVRALVRLHGVPEERIRRLEQDVLVEAFSERDRAELAFARRLSRAAPLPRRDDLRTLHEHGQEPDSWVGLLADEAIKEIACTVGAVCPSGGRSSRRSRCVALSPPQPAREGIRRRGRLRSLYLETPSGLVMTSRSRTAIAPLKGLFAATVQPGDHGGTYAGKPLACAAANAVLAAVEKEGLVERAAELGSRLRARLERFAEAHPERVAEVRGRGLLLGMELRGAELAGALPRRAASRGVLVNVTAGTVLRLLPALDAPPEEVEPALDTVLELVTEG